MFSHPVRVSSPARADIFLNNIRHNLETIRGYLDGQAVMSIVKADAYGHGRKQVAEVLARRSDYFGVAHIAEALTLRDEVGPDPKILAWIYAPGAPLDQALQANIELSVGAPWAITEVAAACRATGITARVHLKVDTGMTRGGFNLGDIEEAARALRQLEAEGMVEVVGLWSHLSRADEPMLSTTEQQIERFEEARRRVRNIGIKVKVHHLAASAGALWHPCARYDMVRPGIALYGLSPNSDYVSAESLGLRAAMELSADLIVERDVPQGTGVSYGHTEVTQRPLRLAVVPLGYSDGIPRAASSCAPLVVGGVRTRIVGRVCMDQFMVEVPDTVVAGERAVLFGGPGYPSADEWGKACQTIGYEIVARIGPRVRRNYHE